MNYPSMQRAYEKALSLFKSKIVDSTIVRKQGKVSQPIPIEDSDGNMAAWFVPITVGSKMVGYFQLSLALELLRYASFQRSPEKIENCPDAVDWLDLSRVKKLAGSVAFDDERLSLPRLTYDTDISRVVWAVMATRPDGETKRIFVAGKEAYREMDRTAPFTGRL
jgi:hypothetical protein